MNVARRALAAAVYIFCLGAPSAADIVGGTPVDTSVDRAVVRFVARETGGVDAPRFIFERQLAFEARIEALTEGDVREGDPPFRPRHVSAAIERHIAETVLESLSVEPRPTEIEIERRVDQARLSLIERVGGVVPLTFAARAEGVEDGEVLRLLRRQALASIYLDRMIAPMLDPSDAELRNVQRTQRTPFSGKPFADVAGPLRRWYVQDRLAAAVASFYDGLRTRLTVSILR